MFSFCQAARCVGCMKADRRTIRIRHSHPSTRLSGVCSADGAARRLRFSCRSLPCGCSSWRGCCGSCWRRFIPAPLDQQQLVQQLECLECRSERLRCICEPQCQRVRRRDEGSACPSQPQRRKERQGRTQPGQRECSWPCKLRFRAVHACLERSKRASHPVYSRPTPICPPERTDPGVRPRRQLGRARARGAAAAETAAAAAATAEAAPAPAATAASARDACGRGRSSSCGCRPIPLRHCTLQRVSQRLRRQHPPSVCPKVRSDECHRRWKQRDGQPVRIPLLGILLPLRPVTSPSEHPRQNRLPAPERQAEREQHQQHHRGLFRCQQPVEEGDRPLNGLTMGSAISKHPFQPTIHAPMQLSERNVYRQASKQADRQASHPRHPSQLATSRRQPRYPTASTIPSSTEPRILSSRPPPYPRICTPCRTVHTYESFSFGSPPPSIDSVNKQSMDSPAWS